MLEKETKINKFIKYYFKYLIYYKRVSSKYKWYENLFFYGLLLAIYFLFLVSIWDIFNIKIWNLIFLPFIVFFLYVFYKKAPAIRKKHETIRLKIKGKDVSFDEFSILKINIYINYKLKYISLEDLKNEIKERTINSKKDVKISFFKIFSIVIPIIGYIMKFIFNDINYLDFFKELYANYFLYLIYIVVLLVGMIIMVLFLTVGLFEILDLIINRKHYNLEKLYRYINEISYQEQKLKKEL